MLNGSVRFGLDGSHLPTCSQRRNNYGLNAQHAVYDSSLPRSVCIKKIKPSTDDWVLPGVGEIDMAHFIGRGNVFDAYPAAE